MITDDPEDYWIRIRPSKGTVAWGLVETADWVHHGGKFLIFGPKGQLDRLARDLDVYVEDGTIRSVKYNREPGVSKSTVMCVYCLDDEQEQIRGFLDSLGVTKPIWKYDRQTIKDWRPSGRLHWKAQQLDSS